MPPPTEHQTEDLQTRLARLELQNHLLQEELRVTAILFESQEGMLVTDAKSVILRVNQAFTRLTGYTAEEVVGKQPNVFFTQLHDETFYDSIRRELKAKGFWQGNIQNRRKNGVVYTERLNISVVKSHAGEITHYVASFTDISREQAFADRIQNLAYYDPLTSLPNRRLFQERLSKALASLPRKSSGCALLFIDIDNFKDLNDTLGHDSGDLLLTLVATRLKDCLREYDTAARLGGDEFVVVLEELDHDPKRAAMQAGTVADKILKVLKQNYTLGNCDFRTTVSIGVTVFNSSDVPVEELLKQADIAMYASKMAGRDRMQFFNPDMQDSILENQKLRADLIHAVSRQQFDLHYQIQVNQNGQAVGAEALLRWPHPGRGLVSPMAFIPLAEQSGLILPIGQWVLETACKRLNFWATDSSTRELQLAVNISAHQFHDDAFVDQVCGLIDKYSVQPGRLKLELTESLLLDKAEETIEQMHRLKRSGVLFSMDDFGTGYSSLSYLSRLPFDQLKIDQSFVRNMNNNPADAVIVQTIIGMASNLGMTVIAEGVESGQQRDFLLVHGCTEFQGYLYGKPCPVSELEAKITATADNPELNHREGKSY